MHMWADNKILLLAHNKCLYPTVTSCVVTIFTLKCERTATSLISQLTFVVKFTNVTAYCTHVSHTAYCTHTAHMWAILVPWYGYFRKYERSRKKYRYYPVDRTTGMKGHVKRAYWYQTSTVQLLFDLDRRSGAADIDLNRGFRILQLWQSVDSLNTHLERSADIELQTTLTLQREVHQCMERHCEHSWHCKSLPKH